MQVRLAFAQRQPAVYLAAVVAVVALAAGALGVARAARAARPAGPSVTALRALVDHYRTVTWTFERAAHVPRVPSTFAERHSRDRSYLRGAIDRWTRRAYLARRQALQSLRRRFAVALPTAPRLRAPLAVTLAYNRRLTLALRGIYPGHPSRSFASVHGPSGRAILRVWQKRSAAAALAVSLHAERHAKVPAWLAQAFTCIHRYEASWNANTGNGYYGGLQMDMPFQSRYGPAYLNRYGTADRWPVWAQLEAAARRIAPAEASGPGRIPPASAVSCNP